MSSVNFLIGKQLGKYEVTEHISHGGMAEVYLGRQHNLERYVAIKVLHPFLAGEQGFVSRFQREAQIVATMRHPNVVQVYDFDHHEELDIYYMVMEYIKGNTLKERLKSGPLGIEATGYITVAIAEAMDYAHRREMVHRDIKPANIMFTEDGDPVLADFGIARMLSLTGLTASGAMVGTPAYMAPEIGAGESGTAASDIYSLGVVLYEMLTGHLPFEADIPMSLVMKHINDPVPSPKQYVPKISDGYEAIVFKALAKEPGQRYATAGRMAKALRSILDLETPSSSTVAVAAKPVRSAEQPAEPEEEGPLLRSWPDTDTSQISSTSTRKKGKKRRTVLRRLVLLVFLLLALGTGGWAAANGQLPIPEVLAQLWTSQLSPEPTRTAGTPLPSLTVTATSVPAGAVTLTPEPTVTPQPSPTQTLSTVAPRAEVLRLYTSSSDEPVSPETVVLAYITLRNGGSSPWLEGTRLSFVRGEQMNAPSTLDLDAVAAGEQVQVLLPLLAPAEAGEYESIWEVQQPDGRSISSQIQLTVVVQEGLPTPTSTPTFVPEVEATPTAVTPLALAEPVLEEWQVDDEQNTWTGTLSFSVEGGSGGYRLYWDVIAEDTEIFDNQLTFQWQKCVDFPLKVIVTSGDETVSWEGEVSYPLSEECVSQP